MQWIFYVIGAIVALFIQYWVIRLAVTSAIGDSASSITEAIIRARSE